MRARAVTVQRDMPRARRGAPNSRPSGQDLDRATGRRATTCLRQVADGSKESCGIIRAVENGVGRGLQHALARPPTPPAQTPVWATPPRLRHSLIDLTKGPFWPPRGLGFCDVDGGSCPPRALLSLFPSLLLSAPIPHRSEHPSRLHSPSSARDPSLTIATIVVNCPSIPIPSCCSHHSSFALGAQCSATCRLLPRK